MRQFRHFDDGYLIALDGTQAQSSERVHCDNCSVKCHGGKTHYSHSVLCASIVSPDIKEAVALVPEFITPQDGCEKQDCEFNAAKRWLKKHAETYKRLKPTIIGDDLFSKQPMCDAVVEAGFDFVMVCKPESHKFLYSYIQKFASNVMDTKVSSQKGRRASLYQYKFLNYVPLRDGQDATYVSWVEVTESDKKTGKQLYKNSFITNKAINHDNAHKIASAGRARWRLENENNNTLKTKGYHFEHNYGHGKKNLSSVLTSLTIVAFLYHTIMNLMNALYVKAKHSCGARDRFFEAIRHFTSKLVFKSWDHLLEFIHYDPSELEVQTWVFDGVNGGAEV